MVFFAFGWKTTDPHGVDGGRRTEGHEGKKRPLVCKAQAVWQWVDLTARTASGHVAPRVTSVPTNRPGTCHVVVNMLKSHRAASEQKLEWAPALVDHPPNGENPHKCTHLSVSDESCGKDVFCHLHDMTARF